MKLWIAIVAFIAIRTDWEVNAKYYLFENFGKYYSVSPTNDMIYTANITIGIDHFMMIDIKQTIDKDNNPLLISSTITNVDNKMTVFDGGPFNICEKQKIGSWDNFVVTAFNLLMIPVENKRKCPVKPKTAELANWVPFYGMELDDTVDLGNYDINYVAKTSQDEIVFSSLRFTFVLPTPPED